MNCSEIEGISSCCLAIALGVIQSHTPRLHWTAAGASLSFMTPHALQDISKLEDTLWEAADQLRANSKLTSSEYCFHILGIIFLRHATNRYNAVAARIEEEKAAGKLPKKLPITKAHFIARRALMLPPEARYETLIALPKGTNLGGRGASNCLNLQEKSGDFLRGDWRGG